VLFLYNLPDDLAIVEIHQAIGNLVIRFPLLHCQECAKTLKQWLKQRKIPGKLNFGDFRPYTTMKTLF
jgi:hypothetical protein